MVLAPFGFRGTAVRLALATVGIVTTTTSPLPAGSEALRAFEQSANRFSAEDLPTLLAQAPRHSFPSYGNFRGEGASLAPPQPSYPSDIAPYFPVPGVPPPFVHGYVPSAPGLAYSASLPPVPHNPHLAWMGLPTGTGAFHYSQSAARASAFDVSLASVQHSAASGLNLELHLPLHPPGQSEFLQQQAAWQHVYPPHGASIATPWHADALPLYAPGNQALGSSALPYNQARPRWSAQGIAEPRPTGHNVESSQGTHLSDSSPPPPSTAQLSQLTQKGEGSGSSAKRKREKKLRNYSRTAVVYGDEGLGIYVRDQVRERLRHGLGAGTNLNPEEIKFEKVEWDENGPEDRVLHSKLVTLTSAEKKKKPMMPALLQPIEAGGYRITFRQWTDLPASQNAYYHIVGNPLVQEGSPPRKYVGGLVIPTSYIGSRVSKPRVERLSAEAASRDST
ncbi:hypothetical protein ACQY0O_004799 [Thecaphora frezii]